MPNGLGAIFDRGLNQALERRLFLRDDVGLSLSPELVASLDITNNPEIQYHLGWRRYAVGSVIGASVGNSPMLRIKNVQSNAILIIEYVLMSAAVVLELGASFGFGAIADLATTLGGLPTDSRVGFTAGTGQGRLSIAAAATQVPTDLRFFQPANDIRVPPIFPIILCPDSSFNYFAQQQNQAVDISVCWRERMLNDQENTP